MSLLRGAKSQVLEELRETRAEVPKTVRSLEAKKTSKRDQNIRRCLIMFDMFKVCLICLMLFHVICTSLWRLTIMFLCVPFWSLSFGMTGGLHTHHACIASASLKNCQRSDDFLICFGWFCLISVLSYCTLSKPFLHRCSLHFGQSWKFNKYAYLRVILLHIINERLS